MIKKLKQPRRLPKTLDIPVDVTTAPIESVNYLIEYGAQQSKILVGDRVRIVPNTQWSKIKPRAKRPRTNGHSA